MTGIRVVLVHTDLRVYWPPRLRALADHMAEGSNYLHIVEIAGTGSPYDFAGCGDSAVGASWSVLFPKGDLRQIPAARMARAVERNLDATQPDVVMAGGIAYPSGAAAVRWCRTNKRGVVIFDDVRREDVPRSWVVNWVKSRIYRNVDAILIPAESHCASYEFWGVPRTRMFFGLNVVDNEWFSRQAASVREAAVRLRGERSLPRPFFLGVGRLIRQKNWDTLLLAYEGYRRRRVSSPWDLVLVGDGGERESLDALLKQRGIEGARLVGAAVGGRLCEYYGLADCLILPSHGETWGLVVNEAMACGLPVLVSQRCGCAETLVRAGENGWTFSPDNPEELAALMLRMSQQPEAARKVMGQRSREIISEWGLDRFVQGACAAIEACRNVRRGFSSWIDRAIISLWNGRFRPV